MIKNTFNPLHAELPSKRAEGILCLYTVSIFEWFKNFFFTDNKDMTQILQWYGMSNL
jgi:hypothetical protein